jgi:phosphate-selective porin OprO and OprP
MFSLLNGSAERTTGGLQVQEETWIMKNPMFWRFIAISLAVAGVVPATAQSQHHSPAETSVEERLQALELNLERLERRLDEALNTSKLVPRDSASDPGGELVDRFNAIDQKVRILERKRELEQEDLAAQAKGNPVLKAGAEGFSLRSANGNYQLKLRGHVQMDGRFYASDPQQLTRDTFVLRSARPIFEGTVAKYFEFRFMPDFGNGQTIVQDMYLDTKLKPQLNIRAGKFKTPFGLERLQGEADTLFTERALPTAQAPNRDLGVQIFGDLWRGALGYAFGVFNGVVDGGSGDSDDNSSKDFAGRIFAQPFKTTQNQFLKDFGFGLAGTIGNRNGVAVAPSVASYKTAGQQVFFRYLLDGTAAGTVVGAGSLYRISPQAYYYNGPFGMMAEYVISTQDVQKGSNTATFRNNSWQVSASYVLTGEKASYKSVTPRNSSEGGLSVPGAFEIAGRYNELNIDPAAFPIFANPKNSAGSAKAWGIGLNWYINRNVKFVMDFEQTRFNGGSSSGDRETENVILSRVQLAY